MQAIGDTLALLVGENYVNRFNLGGRSYEVIPQVPRVDRLTPEALTRYYVTTRQRRSRCRCRIVVSLKTATAPNALTQLQPAQFRDLPGGADAGRDDGPGGRFPRMARRRSCCRPGSATTTCRSRGNTCSEGNQLVVTFVFALIVIFLVLAAQFESLRDPLVILVSVPMSICGALMPLFYRGHRPTMINIYTQVGLVTLIGLISKHGILMVEFANQLQRQRRARPAPRDRARRARPAAPDPDDDGGDGGRAGAAVDRHRRRRGEPLLDRHRRRRRHVDRHALHAVRRCRRSTPCWPRTTAPPRTRRGAPRDRPGDMRRPRIVALVVRKEVMLD